MKSQSALTQDLYFNVSRLFNELLNKQGSVPKSRQGFRVGPLVILLQLLTNRREKSIRVWVTAAIQEASDSQRRICVFFRGVSAAHTIFPSHRISVSGQLVLFTRSFISCCNLFCFPRLSFTRGVFFIFFSRLTQMFTRPEGAGFLTTSLGPGCRRSRLNLCLSVCDVLPRPVSSTGVRLSHPPQDGRTPARPQLSSPSLE